MTEVSSAKISNFCKGTALADIGAGQEGYANAIIDTDGNVIWAMDTDGKMVAENFFDGKEVTKISSFFNVLPSERDTYYGYFPVEFSVDDYEYTGTYIGILDSSGEWVVEPSVPSHSYAWMLQDYGIVTNAYIFDYAEGNVQYFSGDADEDSTAEEEQDTLRESKEREFFFLQHNNLIFSGDTDISLDFERDITGFYDQNGNLVINLSSYNIVNYPEFTGGYAILEIENEQGSNYLTVIDTSGEEMFSSVKDNGHGALSEGIFFMENDKNGYFMGGMVKK